MSNIVASKTELLDFATLTSSNTTPYLDLGVTVFDGMRQAVQVNLLGFDKKTVTFGRDETNDIVLSSQYASRFHGNLKRVGEHWQIEDLDSRNGMQVNGRRCTTHEIQDGDSVRFDIDGDLISPADSILLIFSQASGNDYWQSVEIVDQITIGREKSCDICLSHISVSKLHAKIVKEASGFFITDNNSTNGVFVNSRRISGPTLLSEKDFVTITNAKLIFSDNKITYCYFAKGLDISASHLVKMAGKKKTILSGVSFEIKPGELVAIVGGSGAGKSTLLNCICGYSQPDSGSVSINGIDLYRNFDVLKNIIGYVPQKDIVYENLNLIDMLGYAARLRLPEDMSPFERRDIIEKAILDVELGEHANTLIKHLSGGQRKRASIAVELISDPQLFFLDEPDSGLDPGNERNLMRTLRGMSLKGKTVVFVTHSTLNLQMCDKILFIGTGGCLCFAGSYNDALEFFGVEDIIDVYNLIMDDPERYEAKFADSTNQLSETGQKKDYASQSHIPKKKHAKSGIGQLAILSARNLRILLNDRIRLMMLIFQAPLLALLISIVADDQAFIQYEMTKYLLFALSCSAFWVGMLNALQEICKERVIFKREYMTGLRLDAYIFSKMLVMSFVCLVQSFLLLGVFSLLIGLQEESIMWGPYLDMFVTLYLTALSATAMGIFISALFKNGDRAMVVAPLMLMPQLLFSGLIFDLNGVTEFLSYITICRWSMESFGTSANLNNLPVELEQQGMILAREAEAYFTFTKEHFVRPLAIMGAITVVFCIVTALVLKAVKKERE